MSFDAARRNDDMNLWAPPVQRLHTPPPSLQGALASHIAALLA
jgi:hypothetical protein